MGEVIGVAGYQMSFPDLTADLLQHKPKVYEMSVIYIGLEELKNGFYMSRIGKATRKGTSISFKAIKTVKRKLMSIASMQTLIRDLNQKYDTNLEVSFT